MKKLHVELVKLQEWVKLKGLKVCIVFEGRDGAGKGGTIKAITERVSPRVFRVIALTAPTEREKSQMYIQRYLPHLAGRRRGRDLRPQLVQPRGCRARNGFLHRGGGGRVPEGSAGVREIDGQSGIILLKYWLEVSPDEQTRRLEARINDGRKIWKLSPMDLKSYNRWYDYSRARDAMFAATDTAWAPWFVARSDDKQRARLNIISHLLGSIKYKDVPREKVKLPKRQKAGGLSRAELSVQVRPGKALRSRVATAPGSRPRRHSLQFSCPLLWTAPDADPLRSTVAVSDCAMPRPPGSSS